MIDISRYGQFPDRLTSYDVWKFAAILLMIIDHVGFLLFPDQEWMRVLGRLCVPIWFFLIGYARTRDVPGLWIMAAILVDLPDPLLGLGMLPLNILFTLLIVRLALNPLVKIMRLYPHYFWMMIILLAVLSPVTNFFTEYGTMGLLLAMLGLQARRPRLFRGRLAGVRTRELLWPGIGIAYWAWQSLHFGFSGLSIIAFAIGLVFVLFGLYRFKPHNYESDTRQWQVRMMMICGRYSLEIYVLHLVVLKLLFAFRIFL